MSLHQHRKISANIYVCMYVYMWRLTFSGVLFSLVEAKDCSVLWAKATTAAASCCWWCCAVLKPSVGFAAAIVGKVDVAPGAAVAAGVVIEVGEWAMAAAFANTDVGCSLLCSDFVAKTSKSFK